MNRPDQFPFDFEAGEAARDEGVKRVSAHAETDFITAGREALRKCCLTMVSFTTDEIWALIPEIIRPHEPRAMAAIMKFAESNNWAYPLDQYRPSSRPKAHRGPKRVWRSTLWPMGKGLQPSYEQGEQEPVEKEGDIIRDCGHRDPSFVDGLCTHCEG